MVGLNSTLLLPMDVLAGSYVGAIYNRNKGGSLDHFAWFPILHDSIAEVFSELEWLLMTRIVRSLQVGK